MLHRLLTTMSRGQKSVIFLVMDLVLLVVALVGTNAFLLGQLTFLDTLQLALPYLAVMIPATAFSILVFGLHRVQLNFYERSAILQTTLVGVIAGLSGLAASAGLGSGVSVQFFVIVTMAFVLLSAATRLIVRELVVSIYRNRRDRTRVLIYGAGRRGQQLASALMTDEEIVPVAFVDDDRTMLGLNVGGLKVYAGSDLERLVNEMRIDRVVLAMPSVSETDKIRIAESLSPLSCEVHAMPSFAAMVMDRRRIEKTEPLDFSKLLGRNQLEADLPGVRDMYRGKVILVTGAGGSIGSEVCLQVALSDPKAIIMLDHSEYALYAIQRQMKAKFKDVPQVAVLGSVCCRNLVNHIFATHDVDVVLHAAAYKQLPMLETNEIEGLRNNVLGTKVVATAAMRNGVESFILISTDKAVRPTSWLGFSKRFAEILVQDMASRSTCTRMSMVRFGNVLGSSGSVIPLFQDQIASGGPVTLTHNDVTRYFMTVSEAVRLVLLAGTLARGGDVFVLDMGEPVPIRRLARNLIEASGYSVRDDENPDGEIALEVTGLRAGEKMKEELLIGSDMLTTPHPKILRAQEIYPSEIEMATILQQIQRIVDSYDAALLDELTQKWARFLGTADQPSDTIAVSGGEPAPMT